MIFSHSMSKPSGSVRRIVRSSSAVTRAEEGSLAKRVSIVSPENGPAGKGGRDVQRE